VIAWMLHNNNFLYNLCCACSYDSYPTEVTTVVLLAILAKTANAAFVKCQQGRLQVHVTKTILKTPCRLTLCISPVLLLAIVYSEYTALVSMDDKHIYCLGW